jgi:hypothetical protein
MAMESTLTFNEILEEIEALPEDDQATLIDLLQRRRVERRRSEIAANILEAKQAYQAGQVFRGSVDDAIAELNN